jgi:hypothetical protein
MITVVVSKEMQEKLAELGTEECRPIVWHDGRIVCEDMVRFYRALARLQQEAATDDQAQGPASLGKAGA